MSHGKIAKTTFGPVQSSGGMALCVLVYTFRESLLFYTLFTVHLVTNSC